MLMNNRDIISDVKSTSLNNNKIKQVNKKRFEKFYKETIIDWLIDCAVFYVPANTV